MKYDAFEEQRHYLETVIAEWEKLLTERHSESVYQAFLARHAGLFLAHDTHDAVIISKLKLGADYESDFVIVRDNFSHGLEYVFVEIEVPYGRLLTGPSRPGRRLNSALAQIDSWKQWIATHASDANNLLPSKSARYGGAPNFDFEVFIGRRPASKTQPPDLTWFKDFRDVRVYSFDHFTSNARMRIQHASHSSPALSQYPKAAKPALDRIDWAAISHRQWRKFTRDPGFHDQHLLEQSWELIVRTRKDGW